MRTFKTTWIFGVLVVLICALYAPAMAWQVNEHYTNNTGQTAYDLTKILMGDVVCTDTMMNQPFNSFTRMPFGAFTFFHWYDGTVAPGEMGHACFSTNAPTVPPFAAYWTNASGQFLGPAGPVMVPNIGFNPETGEALFKIGNEWRYWNGTGFPPQTGEGMGAYVGDVLVSSAYYALDSVKHNLEDLDSLHLINLPWVELPEMGNYTLIPGSEIVQNIPLDPGDVANNTQLLFMFKVEGDGQQAYNVIQKSLRPERVPSLTNWGLFAVVVLLIASAIIVIYNRRKQVTA